MEGWPSGLRRESRKLVGESPHRFESCTLRHVKKFRRIEIFNVAGTLKFALRIYCVTANMFYYVYILQSSKNNSLYIGYNSNLKNRLREHNSGLSQATKPFIPYKLIFYEAFLDRTDVKNREKYLKGGYGRKTIKSMLSKYLK